MGRHLAHTALGDLDAATGLAAAAALSLDGLDNVHAVNDLTEDDVLAVQPASHHSGDEELRAVGVRTSVGHREQTRLVVLELEVLVSELGAVDRLAARAVASGEVTTLEHKVRDHTVEVRAGVAEALLASAESTEVSGSLRNHIVEQLELNSAERGAVLGNVEENVRHSARGSCKLANDRRSKSHPVLGLGNDTTNCRYVHNRAGVGWCRSDPLYIGCQHTRRPCACHSTAFGNQPRAEPHESDDQC